MGDDERFMQIAINEAFTVGSETWKNPRVGAVIVKDGEVLACGHTHEYGQVHAERDVINQLEYTQTKGATLYVTLEPCDHFGKQPPCTQAIIESGISRVVIAQKDPHNLVTGKGITRLQRNNITVKTGVLLSAVSGLNPHYDFFYRHRRPWITLKQAVSLDYRVNAVKGQRTVITNSLASKVVHAERANFQGILIGSETAIVDNPRLLPIPKGDFLPVRIVLDRRGRLANYPTLRLLTDEQAPTWIFTENSALQEKFSANVRVFYRKKWSLKMILQKLGDAEIQSLYVEGGPTVQHEFLKQNLVEELITYVSPQFLGRDGVLGIQADERIIFAEKTVKLLENDIRIAERKMQHV